MCVHLHKCRTEQVTHACMHAHTHTHTHTEDNFENFFHLFAVTTLINISQNSECDVTVTTYQGITPPFISRNHLLFTKPPPLMYCTFWSVFCPLFVQYQISNLQPLSCQPTASTIHLYQVLKMYAHALSG